MSIKSVKQKTYGDLFKGVSVPFDVSTLDVLVVKHASDGQFVEGLILAERRRRDPGDEYTSQLNIVTFFGAANQLPRGCDPDVFKNKNVLVCGMVLTGELARKLDEDAKFHFTMGYNNSVDYPMGKSLHCSAASGCGMVWGWLHGNKPMPAIIYAVNCCTRFDFDGVDAHAREDMLAVFRAFKEDKYKAMVYSIASEDPNKEPTVIDNDRTTDFINEIISDGKTFISEDAHTFETDIENGLFLPKGANDNCTGYTVFLVHHDNFKAWADLGTYFFAHHCIERGVDFLAILRHEYKQIKVEDKDVDVPTTKYSFRRLECAAPLDTRVVTKDIFGGGGLEGASAFSVEGHHTPAEGLPRSIDGKPVF